MNKLTNSYAKTSLGLGGYSGAIALSAKPKTKPIYLLSIILITNSNLPSSYPYTPLLHTLNAHHRRYHARNKFHHFQTICPDINYIEYTCLRSNRLCRKFIRSREHNTENFTKYEGDKRISLKIAFLKNPIERKSYSCSLCCCNSVGGHRHRLVVLQDPGPTRPDRGHGGNRTYRSHWTTWATGTNRSSGSNGRRVRCCKYPSPR